MANTLITDQRSTGGSYRILRRLGKGGMAEVFLACQEGIAGFRRLAVLKKILPQFSAVEDVADMLLDEARIAAQLTHPNIVQIYELFRDGGQYSIAMEFVDGCDLATLARIERHRQSRVPLRLTLRVVSEAAMGLDYAHRQTGLDGRPLNIVHRDMSPHNIMCSREGAVKITDFGIAKAVGKVLVTQVGVVKGKVQYMSPEQYTGGDVDNRSDIFSLGVVLYQLTAGKLPRVAKDGGLAMRRVVEGSIPRPSEIRPDYPEELEGIVMRALAHNPNERYPDAASLREDLLEFARENDLLAFPKELGDYVNALVPPKPVVVREQSRLEADGPSSAITPEVGPPDASEVHMTPAVEPIDLPSVMVEGEEADTEAPSGTEVASPGGKRDAAVTHTGSHPFGRTEIPIEPSEQALLTDEQLTPMPETDSDIDPLAQHSGANSETQRSNQADIATAHNPGKGQGDRSPRRQQRPRGGLEKQPPQPERTARSKGRVVVWIAGAAVIAILASAATIFYMTRTNESDVSSARSGREAPPPPGAGVIDVLATPSAAHVAVDGAKRCPSTPCHIAGLPLNRELLLTVRAKGHDLWMQRLVLTEHEPKLLLRAELTPSSDKPQPRQRTARRTAASKRRVAQSSAKASKGHVKQRQNEAESAAGEGVDSNSSEASSAGGEADSAGPRNISSPRAQGQMLTTDIEGDRSLLAVDVRPWAEVWIDGTKRGHTPLQLTLEVGPRAIQLKNPKLKFSKTFRVRAQKGKKVKISLAIQPPEGAAPPPPG